MTYYIFKNACATKESGPEFPQIQKMNDGYNYDAPDSVDYFSKFQFNHPDFVPNLEYFILHNQAKLTDVLSSVFCGVNCFIVSKKFKDLVSSYRLPKHHFYSCLIKYKNTIIKDYYFLQIISDFKDFVDFKNSIFVVKDNYSKNLSIIDITSKQDYLFKDQEIRSEGKFLSIWAEKIKLIREFDKTLELFKISNFDSNFYITNKLQEELVRNKITGIELSSAKNLELNY